MSRKNQFRGQVRNDHHLRMGRHVYLLMTVAMVRVDLDFRWLRVLLWVWLWSVLWLRLVWRSRNVLWLQLVVRLVMRVVLLHYWRRWGWVHLLVHLLESIIHWRSLRR
jgi:hypothetical protein